MSTCWQLFDNLHCYRADVTKQNETHIYYHTSDVEFKYWYNNHKNSFRNQDYEKKTELSKHIWQLKCNGTEFNLKWSIVTLENLLRISYNDTMMKLSTVIPYLKKIQKLYESRDKLIDLCWHQHFFTGNYQILLYQEIQIWSPFRYIFLILLTLHETLRIVLINMVINKHTPGLLKIKDFWIKVMVS